VRYELSPYIKQIRFVFKGLIYILNLVLSLKFSILCLCIGSKSFRDILMYIYFVMHLPEDGRMSG
jgi:hypothetical protein